MSISVGASGPLDLVRSDRLYTVYMLIMPQFGGLRRLVAVLTLVVLNRAMSMIWVGLSTCYVSILLPLLT
jgi:hypothetical protein